MSHSLNEIEALSKRASRGAGLSWGMSEEAGKATRWLASHNLPSAVILAEVLNLNDGVDARSLTPKSFEGALESTSGKLCPIASGAALNDYADALLLGQVLEMSNVSYPLLLVPFAGWAAIHIKVPVIVSWSSTRISTDGYDVWIDDPQGEIDVAMASKVTCTMAKDLGGHMTAPALRGTVSKEAVARLGTLAHRTYAPATEESRVLGAGAGETDND